MKSIRKILQNGKKTADYLRPMNIPLHAANTGFFVILSIFPCLLLLLGILRYTDYDVADLVELLGKVLPQSLMSTVQSLIETAYRHSSGTVVSVSVLATLWSASKGTYGLLRGLSAVYGTEKSWSYWRGRARSVLYTILLLIALACTLVIHMFGNFVLDYLWMTTDPFVMGVLSVMDLQFLVLLVALTVLFAVMYALLPNQHRGFKRHLPGALCASLGWSLYSRLFSVYVEYFSNYYNIYGSIYAAALGMLWLYCAISILLYGGALNRYLSERKSKK